MWRKNRKARAVFLVCWLAWGVVAWRAQTPGRGVSVRIADRSGRAQTVNLYAGSYALVIGESKYANGWDELPGVAKDVAAVGQVLQRHGFRVETESDLTGRELEARVKKFVDDYGYAGENRLLIYFAGHGYTQPAAGTTANRALSCRWTRLCRPKTRSISAAAP